MKMIPKRPLLLKRPNRLDEITGITGIEVLSGRNLWNHIVVSALFKIHLV